MNFTLKLTKQSGSLLGDEEKGMFSLDFTNLQVISIVHFPVSSVNYIFPLKNYVLGECSLHRLSVSTRTRDPELMTIRFYLNRQYFLADLSLFDRMA